MRSVLISYTFPPKAGKHSHTKPLDIFRRFCALNIAIMLCTCYNPSVNRIGIRLRTINRGMEVKILREAVTVNGV